MPDVLDERATVVAYSFFLWLLDPRGEESARARVSPDCGDQWDYAPESARFQQVTGLAEGDFLDFLDLEVIEQSATVAEIGVPGRQGDEFYRLRLRFDDEDGRWLVTC